MGYIFKVNLPIKIESVANLSEHWSKKRNRQNKQKKLIKLSLLSHKIKLPCRVTLTRLSSRSLDEHDNLRSAMKHIIDCIADILLPGKAPGFADACKDIKWEFGQVNGLPKEYGLIIEMEQL